MPSARALPSVCSIRLPVDGERALLVEPRGPAELGDRVEQCDEAARREDRRRVVRGLAAGREPDRGRADRLGHLGEERRELVVTLDGDGRAVQRGDRALGIGERDERMERADLGPRRARRLEDLRAEDPGRVDERLAAVQPELARELLDRVVRHREDHQLDLVEDRRRFDKRPHPGHEGAEPVAARLVSRRDGDDRPARPMQGGPERRPHRTRADEPDERRLARLGVPVGMLVARLARAVLVVGRRRIEVDSRPAELVDRRGVGDAGRGRPGARPSRACLGGPERALGVPFHVSSLASVEVRQRAKP